MSGHDNWKTGDNHGARRAAALAVVTAVAALTAGCGVVHIHFGSSPGAGSETYQANLAYAKCMRTHGVPGFPDPNPAGGVDIRAQPHGTTTTARANAACEHLLHAGSTGTGSGAG